MAELLRRVLGGLPILLLVGPSGLVPGLAGATPSATCWSPADGLVDARIDALAFDASGRPWVGTPTGLSTRHLGAWGAVEVPTLPEGPVTDLVASADGALWIAFDEQGVARVDDGAVSMLVPHGPDDDDGLRSAAITALADGGRALWVGTRSGLDRVGPDGRVAHQLLDPMRQGGESITSVLETGGRLWIGLRVSEGSDDAALELLDLTASSARSTAFDGGPRRTVRALAADADGALWVGADDGLFVLRSPLADGDVVFERLLLPGARDAEEPTPVLSLAAVDADADADADAGERATLWVATATGAARLDADGTVHELVAPKLSDQSADARVTTLAVAADGALWLGTTAGLCRSAATPLTPSVQVAGVQVVDTTRGITRVGAGEGIELVEGQGIVVGLADAPSAGPAGFRQVSYRLEGFDAEWHVGGASIHYAALPAGEYTLHVRGHDAAGEEPGLSLPVTVRHHLWRSTGAFALYGLLVAALIVGLVWSDQRKVETEKATHERLRELDRLKDDFLINTARQLFGPLHRLVGLAESLLQGAAGELPGSMRKSLRLIIDSAWRLNRTIGDLSRFSGGGLLHRQAPSQVFDLQEMVERVASLYHPLAEQRGIDLVDDVAPDVPLVLTDPEALDVALKGLIGHTLQNLAYGRILLTVTPTMSDAGARSVRLELAVRSRSAGALRLDAGTLESRGLRRSLEELSGGTFSEQVGPEGGLLWHWLLPASDQQTPSTTALAANPDVLDTTMRGRASHETAATPRRSWEAERGEVPWRVLIVDDEEIVCHLLESLLRVEGFEVLVADHGERALEILEREPVDLMLVDIRMPGMSGYQVCQAVRERFSMYELPVIFLTGLRGSSNLMQGIAAGGNDYLTKPLSREELLARLDLHLSLLSIHRSLERILEEHSTQVQMLWKLMPLCSVCDRRFRDLEGVWRPVEHGLETARSSEVGVQLCGDCAAQVPSGGEPSAGG
ncbi:MAG: response regulator [Acidobacteriota bacterium]